MVSVGEGDGYPSLAGGAPNQEYGMSICHLLRTPRIEPG